MLQEDMRRRLYVSAMQRGAAVYAVLLLPLGYVMPPYLAWENGVLEMLQKHSLIWRYVFGGLFFPQDGGNGRKIYSPAVAGGSRIFFTASGAGAQLGTSLFPDGNGQPRPNLCVHEFDSRP